MELNREQIIKALECCGTGTSDDCRECPFFNDENISTEDCMERLIRYALALIKELTEENERLSVASDKQKLWENVLKAEAQEVPIKAERIRVADAITDEIYMRYRQGECFDKGEYRYSPFNCDKFKALIEDVRAKYIPEEKWEDRDC